MFKTVFSFILLCFALTSFSQENKDSTKFFVIVEEMPVYPGCEVEATVKDRNDCTNEKIFNHVIKNTQFPSLPDNKKYDGIVYVNFLIDRNGNVDSVNIIKSFPGNHSELFNNEAIRVINSLPKMTPAKQKGKNVKVKYTIPLKFRGRGNGKG